MLKTISLLNVKITNESQKDILKYLLERIKKTQKKTFIITPNPEIVVYASKHLAYQSKLNQATIALPDGVGLFFAADMKGKSIKERITGVDFIESLCVISREKPLSMGFLGGKAGVAEKAAECLIKKYPWLNIVYVSEEWSTKGFVLNDKLKTKQENINSVVQHRVPPDSAIIDILFVAFGVPKQEEWIYENLPKLPIKAAMGVGGAFDFLGGSVQRAPFFVRFIGLEWLFRLFVQPWRWKRQIALLEFIFLVFKGKS